MLRSTNNKDSSRGSHHQFDAPCLGQGANPRYLKEKLQVLDRTKALYGPRTQAYGKSNYLKEKLQVLDRTKALYGPRTQAYGKTNYLKEIIQVLDRTKALYGPRTQAYGETNYLKEKIQVSDTTRYNHTSVHGSEARCYRKHSQNSTLLGNPLGWFILGSSFSGNYLTRVTIHSAIISVSLISLICY